VGDAIAAQLYNYRKAKLSGSSSSFLGCVDSMFPGKGNSERTEEFLGIRFGQCG
jgi:hypothetical protein